MKDYRAGIDIGSTTVKLIVLGDNDEILFGEYRRHKAHTQATLAELVREVELATLGITCRGRLVEVGYSSAWRRRMMRSRLAPTRR